MSLSAVRRGRIRIRTRGRRTVVSLLRSAIAALLLAGCAPSEPGAAKFSGGTQASQDLVPNVGFGPGVLDPTIAVHLVGGPVFSATPGGTFEFRSIPPGILGSSPDLAEHRAEFHERHDETIGWLDDRTLYVRTPWHGDWTEPRAVDLLLERKGSEWSLAALGVITASDLVGTDEFVTPERFDLTLAEGDGVLQIGLRARPRENGTRFSDDFECEFEAALSPRQDPPENRFVESCRELAAARARRR